FIRLVNARGLTWQDRAHFAGIAARLMRRVLVDHARARGYRKRGGGLRRISVVERMTSVTPLDLHMLALDSALEQLTCIDARKSRVMDRRFFGGLSFAEAAEVLHVSNDTIKRDWRLAKLWLLRELGAAPTPEAEGPNRSGH